MNTDAALAVTTALIGNASARPPSHAATTIYTA